MKITKIILIVTVIFNILDADADVSTPSTEKELRDFCQPVADMLDKKVLSNAEMNNGSYCMGLMQGVVESMIGFETVTKTKMICLNGNETYGQFAKIFLKYSNNHPEEWHIPASNGVMNALYDAFRCKSKE